MPRKQKSRRSPSQERSKERVDRILDAARELIGKRGNDAVSMREIAAHAGVPVSSVYDYFPDRNAIIRSLMVSYLGRINERLAVILGGLTSARQIPDAADMMVDSFVEYFRMERELPTIWSAVQANMELRALDVADGRRIADLLATKFESLSPRGDSEGIRSLCLYVVDTIVSTARIAVYTSPQDGSRVLGELKQLIRLRLGTLIPELRKEPRKRSR